MEMFCINIDNTSFPGKTTSSRKLMFIKLLIRILTRKFETGDLQSFSATRLLMQVYILE